VAELCECAKNGDTEGCRKVITKMGLHPSKGDVDGRTGLHIAARYGQLDVAKMLVEEFSVDVNIADNKGQTPLNDAISASESAVANYLRSRNATEQTFSPADINKMLGAASDGDVAQVNTFLQGKMDANAHDYDNRTALHLAAAGGHEQVVRLLLNAGADAKKRDRWDSLAVHDAKRHGHHVIARLLSDAADGKYQHQEIDMTPVAVKRSASRTEGATSAATIEVLAAAASGEVSELKRLKKKGADLAAADYDGRTALHQAAQFGHLSVISFLAGEKKININCQDNDHHTPLADAVANGHKDVADFLKLSGATMITKEGELCLLASQGDIEGLRTKIADGGLDANTADYDGRTAIHLAAANGNVEMISILIELGANVNVQDRFGGSPLDDAVRSNQTAAKDALVRNGAVVQGQGQSSKAAGAAAGASSPKKTVQTMV
jgi:ankyrin repeat protein